MKKSNSIRKAKKAFKTRFLANENSKWDLSFFWKQVGMGMAIKRSKYRRITYTLYARRDASGNARKTKIHAWYRRQSLRATRIKDDKRYCRRCLFLMRLRDGKLSKIK